MSDLYSLEILFLINLDEIKEGNRKQIKKFHKRVEKFKYKVQQMLDSHAVPLGAKLPIPMTQMVGYYETPYQTSIIANTKEETFYNCQKEDFLPICFSNHQMACSYKSYPETVNKNMGYIKSQLLNIGNKFSLHGDFIIQVYKSKENKDFEILSTHEGVLI